MVDFRSASQPRKSDFLLADLDAKPYLPTSWADDIRALADSYSVSRVLVPDSVTSREADASVRIPVETVGGRVVKERTAWLYALYHTVFRELAQKLVDEPVAAAQDDRYGVNINVQRGSSTRYECHVDSNPIEGLLYVTGHPLGGGELVISRQSDVRGPDQIAAVADRLRPSAGRLVFFDARERPHYVEPLNSDDDVRLVVAMNYYVPSCSEADRPADLNRHLFGED